MYVYIYIYIYIYMKEIHLFVIKQGHTHARKQIDKALSISYINMVLSVQLAHIDIHFIFREVRSLYFHQERCITQSF